MSIESSLILISVLLSLILLVGLLAIYNQITWNKAFVGYIEKNEGRRESLHNDLHELIQRRDFEKAETLSLQRLDKYPKNGILHYYLAQVYFYTEKFTEAEKFCHSAIKLEPAFREPLQQYLDSMKESQVV